ncbi:hypothetical protein RvY_04782 [Ramazzottius varieornatus]|uniref:Uncharacterized protein n=1 Tax=Ramazzottius varieornatus TaxID=947166 RepID=A0A1D1V2P7_RAMVA|nr:hypothetical protein RvY_04782 [Ramazzottius varieornatus]
MTAPPPSYQQSYGPPAPAGIYPQAYPQEQYVAPNNAGYDPHMLGGQTVVHVGPPAGQVPVVHTTIIQEERRVNHLLHFCISLFFPPWIFVWICLCLTN